MRDNATAAKRSAQGPDASRIDSKLSIEYLPISRIKPFETNPRRNEKAIPKVAESIRQFGFRNPIIVDKDDVVVAGHTRLLAAKSLGMMTVPVVRAADLTPDQVRAFRIADNRTSEFSEWDENLLAGEFEQLRASLETNLDFLELDKLLNQDPDAEPHVVEIDTSPLEDRFWISVRGPVVSQARALQRLQALMGELDGVTVELGVTQL